MIVVDSSVWIANLRRTGSPAVSKLHSIDLAREQILVGDLILMEVLMGARDEVRPAAIHRDMRTFQVVPLASRVIAAEAARDHRVLRGLSVTVCTGIDLLIGTFCIQGGHTLLHDDRDFAAMQQHLGLSVL